MKKSTLVLLNSLALFCFAYHFVGNAIHSVRESDYKILVILSNLLILGLAICIYSIPLFAKNLRAQNNLSLFAQFWLVRYTFTTGLYYCIFVKTVTTVNTVMYGGRAYTNSVSRDVRKDIVLPFHCLKAYFSSWPMVIDVLFAVFAVAVLIAFLFLYVRGINQMSLERGTTSVGNPPAQSGTPQMNAQDAYQQLNKLKDLKEKQIITEEEYKQKSAEIAKYL